MLASLLTSWLWYFSENIGEVLTRNAPLFEEDTKDLKKRINYLRSKKFTGKMVKSIIIGNFYC